MQCIWATWNSYESMCSRIYGHDRLMTMFSRYFRNKSFVIDPSTTMSTMMPSRESSASIDVWQPCIETCFFTACVPLRDLPYLLPISLSSFNISSKNLTSSGEYLAMQQMKLAWCGLFCLRAMHLCFLQLTPVLLSSRWMVM